MFHLISAPNVPLHSFVSDFTVNNNKLKSVRNKAAGWDGLDKSFILTSDVMMSVRSEDIFGDYAVT